AISSGYGFTQAGPVFVTNCTFVGNVCSNGAALNAAFAGPVFVVNSTFSDNTAIGVSQATLINTIVANSAVSNCSLVVDGGHNISSDGSGNFTTPFSLHHTDPRLGPLADNAGPTLTLA